MKKPINIFPLLFALILFGLFKNYLTQSITQREISYKEFEDKLKNKEISEVVINDQTLKGLAQSQKGGTIAYIANRVPVDLAKRLDQYQVSYRQVVENTWARDLLSWILPPLFFVGIWIFMMRKFAEKGGMGGSLMSVGKSKAKVYVEKNTGVSFEDVAGVDEAKAELQETVNFLKDSQKHGRLGGRMPVGVLLVGPPGTGKTLLAKAVAGEAGVPFFSISGSEFVEMFVGVGAARVRDLFEQARKNSPCIIFIDELDALGKARGVSAMGGGNDEKEQTLNQLLTEMDGFDTQAGIILLAATNRPEILDPALMRSGRFDRQVLVDRPDKAGRIQILNVHLKKIKASESLEIDQVAALTTGFTGADLANLINEAALVATRKEKQEVEISDFNEAIERIIAGLEKKNRLLNEFERKVVAHHEMGHAIVGMALKGVDEVHKVSIIPRGIGALGYTIQRPTEDRFLMRKDELENKICALFGGRAAEEVIFNHRSTGASDDLNRATDMAHNMVTRYGMCDKLGHAAFYKEGQNFLTGQGPQKGFDYSEETAREIDLAMNKILNDCYEKTKKILMDNIDLLRSSSEKLLVQETLEKEDLVNIAQQVVLST